MRIIILILLTIATSDAFSEEKLTMNPDRLDFTIKMKDDFGRSSINGYLKVETDVTETSEVNGIEIEKGTKGNYHYPISDIYNVREYHSITVIEFKKEINDTSGSVTVRNPRVTVYIPKDVYTFNEVAKIISGN
jgi:hypothetical protein